MFYSNYRHVGESVTSIASARTNIVYVVDSWRFRFQFNKHESARRIIPRLLIIRIIRDAVDLYRFSYGTTSLSSANPATRSTGCTGCRSRRDNSRRTYGSSALLRNGILNRAHFRRLLESLYFKGVHDAIYYIYIIDESEKRKSIVE